MSTLNGKSPADSYKDLLHVGQSNLGLPDSATVPILDGSGNETKISVSQNKTEIDFNQGVATKPVLKSSRHRVYVFPSNITSSSLSISLSAGNIQKFTLSVSVTSFSITDLPASGDEFELTLFITQGSGGSKIISSWPSGTVWPSGAAPTLTATAGKTDIIKIITLDGGTTWYGAVVGLNYS